MGADRPTVVFGPAYLDVVVTLDRPLIPGTSGAVVDRSIYAISMKPREDAQLVLIDRRGQQLTITLPEGPGAEYRLAETVAPEMVAEARAVCVVRQLGGMGAGYAKALGGTLRCPLGDDEVGRDVVRRLSEAGIHARPMLIPDCPTDISLVILSPAGDKLATGMRRLAVRQEATAADTPLIDEAGALVFCGARNDLVRELTATPFDAPVMLAPAWRNVADEVAPLDTLAERVSYLTLNTLEWERLAGRATLRGAVPVITVTDGPQGSRVLLRDGDDFTVPAAPFTGTPDTNRAGETYGAAFFATLLREAPDFHRTGRVSREVALLAARHASALAAEQLGIRDFDFPSGI